MDKLKHVIHQDSFPSRCTVVVLYASIFFSCKGSSYKLLWFTIAIAVSSNRFFDKYTNA